MEFTLSEANVLLAMTECIQDSGFGREETPGGNNLFHLLVELLKRAVIAEGDIGEAGGLRDAEDFFFTAVIGEELFVGGGVALFRPFSHPLEADFGVSNIDTEEEEVFAEGIFEDFDVLRRPYARDAGGRPTVLLDLLDHQPDEAAPPLFPEILLRDLLEVRSGRLNTFLGGNLPDHTAGGEERNAVAAVEVLDDLILPGTVLTNYSEDGHRSNENRLLR